MEFLSGEQKNLNEYSYTKQQQKQKQTQANRNQDSDTMQSFSKDQQIEIEFKAENYFEANRIIKENAAEPGNSAPKHNVSLT